MIGGTKPAALGGGMHFDVELFPVRVPRSADAGIGERVWGTAMRELHPAAPVGLMYIYICIFVRHWVFMRMCVCVCLRCH